MVHNNSNILFLYKTVIQEQQQVYTKADSILLDYGNVKLDMIAPIIRV